MKKTSNDLNNFHISRFFAALYFYGAISTAFYVSRGLSIQSAFNLISIYSLMVVVLEYPTGVISDYFGHKISLILGNVFGAISMILLALNYNPSFFYLIALLMAVSASLVSGSDEALLKSISRNFKSDLANYRTFQMIALSISVLIAGFLASINITYPLYATALGWILSTAFLYQIHKKGELQTSVGNIFSLSIEGLKTVKNNLMLSGIIILAGIADGIAISGKTILNSFNPNLGVDIKIIGILISFAGIARIFGFQIAKKFPKFRIRHSLMGAVVALAAAGLLRDPIASAILLVIVAGILAVLGLKSSIIINSLIKDHIRASVISFKNLIVRLVSAVYLASAGYIFQFYNLATLMLTTIITITLSSIVYLVFANKYERFTHSRYDIVHAPSLVED